MASLAMGTATGICVSDCTSYQPKLLELVHMSSSSSNLSNGISSSCSRLIWRSSVRRQYGKPLALYSGKLSPMFSNQFAPSKIKCEITRLRCKNVCHDFSDGERSPQRKGRRHRGRRLVTAMVSTGGGSSSSSSSGANTWTPSASVAMEAKEMERVTAKESLLFAIKDAGGWQSVLSGKASDIAGVDVNEKVLALERLNTVPRPTTSALLEGRWEFAWVGARSPLLLAAGIVVGRLPAQLACIDSLQLLIAPNGTRATAFVKLFSSIMTAVNLICRLSVEGPVRLKEEYLEGLVSTPSLIEDAAPDVLKSLTQQFGNAVQSLPANLTRELAEGLKLPLVGTYSRQILISYLDEEILIARDQAGSPEVLVRMEGADPELGLEDTDYVSAEAEYVD